MCVLCMYVHKYVYMHRNAHLHIWVYMHALPCGGLGLMSCVFLNHSSVCLLRGRVSPWTQNSPLAGLATHLTKESHPYLLSWDDNGLPHPPSFSVGSGNAHSILTLAQCLLTKPLPVPRNKLYLYNSVEGLRNHPEFSLFFLHFEWKRVTLSSSLLSHMWQSLSIFTFERIHFSEDNQWRLDQWGPSPTCITDCDFTGTVPAWFS